MAIRKLPERAVLLKLFIYDPDTGLLVRRIAENNRNHVGDIAGSAHSGGYLTVCVEGRSFLLHRIIWKMVTGEDPFFIDHIDGVRTNNRFANLRSVSSTENSKNQTRSRANTSGVIGVTRDNRRNKWRAQMVVGQRAIYLGDFVKFDDAVAARKEAEREHGFHPNHGKEGRRLYP